MIDSHCHLDYLETGGRIAETLATCLANGVTHVITISVSPSNLDKVVEISDQFEEVYTTQGIHPHEAKTYSNEVHQTIKNKIVHPKVVAIGEIGLDYHYDFSPKEQQIDAFKRQLEIACEVNLPIVIHTREAEEDTIRVMEPYINDLRRKGVFHSFTSEKFLAEQALEWGFYIGFNGIITFKNAANVREIVSLTPLESMLIETDSPYLAPVPHRGKENSPAYLPLVAEKIAEIKGEPSELIAKKSTENCRELFGI